MNCGFEGGEGMNISELFMAARQELRGDMTLVGLDELRDDYVLLKLYLDGISKEEAKRIVEFAERHGLEFQINTDLGYFRNVNLVVVYFWKPAGGNEDD